MRRDYAAVFVSFLFFFAIYCYFGAPGIVFGDSPELALASASLGIAHPPGYPLFSQLSHFLSYIPFTVEYARFCNVFSALMSAATVSVLCLTLRRLGIKPVAAGISGFMFGLSELFFSQALVGEVYSLNSFIMALVIYAMVRSTEEDDRRFMYLAAFLSGIGLANHHTLLSAAFTGFVLFFVIQRRWCDLGVCLLLLLLGMSTYLYLPLRSYRNPVLDWGNPESWSGFLEVITRKQFGFGDRGGQTIDKLLLQTKHFFILFNQQFYPLAALLSLWGMCLTFRRSWKIFIPLLLLFLINGVLTVYALNPGAEEFFLVDEFLTPAFYVAALFSAFALDRLESAKKPVFIAAAILLLGITFYKYDVQKTLLDQRSNILAAKVARDSLAILPDKAFIIGESDYAIFPLWYAQHFPGVRKDVLVLDADFLMLPWFQEQSVRKIPNMKELIPDITSHSRGGRSGRIDFSALEDFKLIQSHKLAENIVTQMKADVFFTYDLGEMGRFFSPEVFRKLRPFGPLYQYTSAHRVALPEPAIDVSAFYQPINLVPEETIFLKPYLPYLSKEAEKCYIDSDIAGTEAILKNIYAIEPDGNNALNLALILAESGTDTQRAMQLAEMALQKSSTPEPRYFMVRGLVQFREGRTQEAVKTLSGVEMSEPDTCQPKIYLLKIFLDSGDKAAVKTYMGRILSQCPETYVKKAVAIINAKSVRTKKP